MPKALIDRDPLIFTGMAEVEYIHHGGNNVPQVKISIKGAKLLMSYNEFAFLVKEVENARTNSGAG